MFVTHLSLADFRSWPFAELEFGPGVTTLTGRNGQGKTNLVEAVEYLATLGSHRVASDAPLIRFGSPRAIVRARVQAGLDDPRALALEIELNAGKANRASLNRGPLKRPRDLLGALRVVLFAPDDLALVKGDPSDRRRFIDELVTQRWPRMAGVRADYDRVLRQRSALLKSLGGRRGPVGGDVASTLDVWDEQLARLGGELLHARLQTLVDLAEPVAEAYLAIAPTNNVARVAYRSSSLGLDPQPGEGLPMVSAPGATHSMASEAPDAMASDPMASGLEGLEPTASDPMASERPASDGTASGSATEASARGAERTRPAARGSVLDASPDDLAAVLRERMLARRQEEIARGVTLVGPHRDDLVLSLGPLPAKGYASHGESWSFALALRLGAYAMLRADGVEPVLVLDDVFAELDEVRRARLAERIAGAEQVLITAAVASDVPESLAGRRYGIADGAVTLLDPGAAAAQTDNVTPAPSPAPPSGGRGAQTEDATAGPAPAPRSGEGGEGGAQDEQEGEASPDGDRPD
ncbi:DNA replication/repair protein RecF [Propioniciclava coleopterorum]|uniref:DNA replication and repair protein RecF n=1 Tax=Propioniciclava coleopterorum TaxID=2714937 RepID=A0A6G7Y5S1_9ACTN|nr:DNA replication/repair protein RecF [Propioniciclava coleopterorum]QIK72150.1 DNA replication/repair protein RecF [Propioniciclava coleopterorum]